MKPSSKNEVMNGIVNAYIAQKALDKANNTHYADTWKILNGADDEIDASLKFDLSEGEWTDIKAYLKTNKIAFTLCLISYKDGHSQNSFVWYDDGHIYATEMNEIGSVVFHIVDNANNGKIKPTDETSSSILKMLLALENGGANGGGGETTTKQVFKGGVDILDKPLDVESKATFGSDVEVDGNFTLNSASNLKIKDGTSIGGGALYEQAKKVGENSYLPDGFVEKYVKGETLGVFFDGTPTQYAIAGQLLTFASMDGISLTCVMFSIDSDEKINASPKLFNLATWTQYNKNLKLFGSVPDDLTTNLATGLINTGDATFYGAVKNNHLAYFNANVTSTGHELFFLQSGSVISSVDVPTDFTTRSQHIDLGDIAKKQATLYRHTITIYEGNTQDGNSICFTTYTPSNTPIDSIQDLTASADGSNKLANTDLECFGVSGTESALVFYNKIHVGTSITNTTLQKATGGSVTLASVYASYTMKDDVTLN